MSLHTLANHIQDAGRGDDKILVHMTPREVGGLEAIARAHGGTLTTNPQTGLPEAGFLDSILPMIAGAALTATGIGAPMAALLVGGAGAIATGDVTKGLMMGLGAYGGAGIGESLASAGASNAAAQVSQGAVTTPPPGVENVFNSATSNYAPSALQAATNPANAGFAQGANQLAQGATNISTGASGFPLANNPNTIVGLPGEVAPAISPYTPTQTYGANMLEGAKNTFSSFDNAKNFAMNNKMNLAMAAAPGLYSAMNPEPVNFTGSSGSKGTVRPYKYDSTLNEEAFAPTTSSAERQFYASEPRFTPAAEGGIMGLQKYAVGGPVEEMSAANAMGSNTGYPMANLQTPMYANPMMSRPVPTNVISPSGDVGVNTYSGEMRMASGGSATAKEPTTDTKYSFDPTTQQYTQSTTTTPAANNLATNPLVVGLMGLAPYMRTMGGGYAGGQGMLPPMYQNKLGAAAPQPTTTTQTMGGTTAPYVPQGIASAQPIESDIQLPPSQTPEQRLGLEAFYPMMEQQLAIKGAQVMGRGYAGGGVAGDGYNLGGYSDGGRLLKGPGDGVSDSIPAVIGKRQPARLADGEFVIPARIVSELGNGSTEAGARKLYAMMERIQKNRKKSVGKDKVAVDSKSHKYLPA